MYCAVLYCAMMNCTVLYCTVLWCIVLYCTVLYCTVQCCTGGYSWTIVFFYPISSAIIAYISSSFYSPFTSFLPSSFLLPLLLPTVPFLSFLPTLTRNTPPPSPCLHRARRCALSSSALSCPLELPRSKSWYVRSNRTILHGTALHGTVLHWTVLCCTYHPPVKGCKRCDCVRIL